MVVADMHPRNALVISFLFIKAFHVLIISQNESKTNYFGVDLIDFCAIMKKRPEAFYEIRR